MKISVHILSYNEEDILPYTLRHYTSFADKVVLHDAMSTDRTREIARGFGVEIRDWVTDGLNDKMAKELKETAWRQDGADWAIMVDADEFIYFPEGHWHTLEAYRAAGVAMVKPRGFEMFSDTAPTTKGQIYDELVMGAPEDKWYAKPALICPPLLDKVVFTAGAHEGWAHLKDGRSFYSGHSHPSNPPTYFLHYHHVWGIEKAVARYTRQRQRLSALNVQMKWGNFDPPLKHAQDKRNSILPGLRRVIE